MDELEILEQVESAVGKDKERILGQHTSHIRLRELLDAALNFKRKFHIKKFNENLPKSNTPWLHFHEEFMLLLNKLESREITGSEAVNEVETWFSRTPADKAKWYSRVLRKDLKAGFNISTANKAGFKIEKFDVQLAKDGHKCKNLDSILAKGAYVSPKFDGYRCIAIIDGDEISMMSRNGTVYKNFPQIEASLLELFKGERHVFDGEIMSNDFNCMQQSAFASKRGTAVGDVAYYIFDYIPFDEWQTDNFKIKASNRYELLDKIMCDKHKQIQLNGINDLHVVGHAKVQTLDQILICEKNFVADGFEGAMVNPDIPYYRGKKSNKMLKFKTMKSMECQIVGCYEGTLGTAFEGTLGGVHVIQENGVTCDVGSGFDLEERRWIWDNQNQVVGRTIETAYQTLTHTNTMLFPIFKRWRPDKD